MGAGMSIDVHVTIEDRGAAIATGNDMKKVSIMRGQTLTSAVLIMCLLVSSCTSLKVVQISGTITSDIHAGDRVKIVTKDGRDVEFKVASVTSEGLTGDNQQVIRFSDVAKLEKEEVSVLKTAGLTGGIVLGLAALFLIIVASRSCGFIRHRLRAIIIGLPYIPEHHRCGEHEY